MARKRKRAVREPTRRQTQPPATQIESSAAAAQAESITSFKSAPMPDGRSLLLEVPPELRNNVYEKVCEDAPAWLPRQNKKYTIIKKSPLALTKKQVREEFLSVSTHFGPLATSVRNYCFGHLITFFNRLADVDLKRMETCEGESIPERDVRIVLVFHGPLSVYHKDQLRRWLDRQLVPEKRGTRINFKYSCKPMKAWENYNFGTILGRNPNPYYINVWDIQRQYGGPNTEATKLANAIEAALT